MQSWRDKPVLSSYPPPCHVVQKRSEFSNSSVRFATELGMWRSKSHNQFMMVKAKEIYRGCPNAAWREYKYSSVYKGVTKHCQVDFFQSSLHGCNCWKLKERIVWPEYYGNCVCIGGCYVKRVVPSMTRGWSIYVLICVWWLEWEQPP